MNTIGNPVPPQTRVEGPFGLGPRRITALTEMKGGVLALDDSGCAWWSHWYTNRLNAFDPAMMRWQRLTALPTYDEAPR